MKGLVLDLGGDFQESERRGSHGAGQDNVRRDVVLIGKHAEGVGVALLGGEEDAEAGGVGVVD